MKIDEFLDLVKTRKSIRRYDSKKQIPAQAEKMLLEAARLAPSAGNEQSWHFFIVKDGPRKVQIARAAYDQRFLMEAPLLVITAVDKERAYKAYAGRGLELYSLQDTAAAIEHMLLAATAMGIGSCWVGAFSEHELALCLGMDSRRYRPVAILAFGYAAEEPAARERLPLEKLVTYL